MANYRDRVRALRDEWVRETGEPMTLATAAALLDHQDEADYQRREGGAYDQVEAHEPVKPVEMVFGEDCPEHCGHPGLCEKERVSIGEMERRAEMAVEHYYEGGWDTTGAYDQ